MEIEQLIHQQLQQSNFFATNFNNMYQSKLRQIRFNNFWYTLQINQARIQSATADITKKIDKSQCFLCKDNLIDGQIAFNYNDNFVIAANPFPIAENHITIISKTHQPQGIIKIIDQFVKMSEDMPNYTVFYNGPKCGASAPFHLHFQACKSQSLPLFMQIEQLKNYVTQQWTFTNTLIYKIDDSTRRFVLIETDNANQAQYYIQKVLSEINRLYNTTEPEINAGIVYNNGYYTITIFPREKHRPKEYFLTDNNRILCSPGYADLAGLIPICLTENFYTITNNNIKSIMNQVCISKDKFNNIYIA